MAVYKETPDFGLYLAEQAVKAYFRNDGKALQAQMAEFCRRENSPNLYRLYLRMQREQLNNMIVETVLRSLPELKQRFVIYRYSDEMTYLQIEARLHASSKLLNDWNKGILRSIELMLFYSLGRKDVFCRMRVVNMIHIIDLRLEAMQESLVPVNQQMVAVLTERRGRYRRLLAEMDECERKAVGDTYNSIVTAKLHNHNDNYTMVASLTGYSCGCVGKNLKKFEERMVRKYIR